MWNIPNTLTLIRLGGIPLLLILAFAGQPVAVLLLGLLLVLTDWLDGALARALHQQTPLGAKLDTIADVLLGLSLVLCVARLDWSFLARHWVAVVMVLASYGLSAAVCLAKFGIWPSYHNYLAKVGMTLGSATGLLLLTKAAGWLAWPLDWLFLLAAGLITLANLESVAITARLRHPRSYVGSVFSLLRRQLH